LSNCFETDFFIIVRGCLPLSSSRAAWSLRITLFYYPTNRREN